MTKEEAIKLLNTLVIFKKVDAPQEEINECIEMAINSLENEEKLLKENRALKNRCKAYSQGVLCSFCPLECEQRAAEFIRGSK